MSDALDAIEAWADDHDADLPQLPLRLRELRCLIDLDVDPALAAAVLEIEGHVAGTGWDQPARLYSLVETARIVAREPALARAMGLDEAAAAGSLTPVEQDQLRPDQPLEQVLETITLARRRGRVRRGRRAAGAAARRRRAGRPTTPPRPSASPGSTPGGTRCGSWPGATRAGSTYCALRLREHDDDQSVVAGIDLVPALLQLLRVTLEEDDQ